MGCAPIFAIAIVIPIHSVEKKSQCMQYRQPENFEALLVLGSFQVSKHW